MIQNPEYSIDIIVLVKNDEKYSWFLSDKTFWVLDYVKWGSIFINSSEINVEPRRKGFIILDKENWPEFEKESADLKVTRNQLSELILQNLPITSWDEKGELFPSLFIDFDSKTLFSLFPELLAFEKYIPDGWTGEFENFYELIPEFEKYWKIDGNDYFPKE